METVSNSDSEPVSNRMACPLRMSVFLKELKCYKELRSYDNSYFILLQGWTICTKARIAGADKVVTFQIQLLNEVFCFPSDSPLNGV